MQTPDADLAMQWLEKAGIPHYLCGQCRGLHLSQLQQRDGVIDARLFVEDFGLSLVTELDLRATALLPATADTGLFNLDFPLLKVFPDVIDGELPKLVAEGILLTGAGVTSEQFRHFVRETVKQTEALVEVCRQREFLVAPEAAPSKNLH